MATTTPGRRSSFVTIGAGMAMLGFAALASPAGAIDNPTTYSGNPSCTDLGLSGLKIDTQPTNGTYHATDAAPVSTEGTVPDTLEIEISNVMAADTVSFDWHATSEDVDFPIDVVLVKFADGGLRWSYAQPGESADTAWSTQDSISHVSFCFDANTGSTDTGSTDTGSTDTGSTDTGTTDTGTTDTGTSGAQVLGNTITRQGAAAAPAKAETLPATGSEDLSLTIAGVVLVALGGVGLHASSRLRRTQGVSEA
jgi:LPXTG-motif cell wall-anchored protein